MSNLTDDQKRQADSLTQTQRELLSDASQRPTPLDRRYGNCLNGGKLNGFVTIEHTYGRRNSLGGRQNVAHATWLGRDANEYLRQKRIHTLVSTPLDKGVTI